MIDLFALDRIEEGVAVLLPQGGGAALELDAALLPPDAHEGVLLAQGADGVWMLCPDETQSRQAAMRARMQRLLNKNRG